MTHPEPSHTVLYDKQSYEVRDMSPTKPLKALLYENGRFREITLRVARGSVSDLPCERIGEG
jgi:hypothetical protein